jgi:hypothetical protein
VSDDDNQEFLDWAEREIAAVIMDERLKEVVQTFRDEHPWCLNPDECRDRCQLASFDFFQAVRAVGVEDAEIISGVQFAYVEFGGIRHEVIENGHFAVRVEDRVYDWTARQFDPNAEVPMVVPTTAWRAQWHDLAARRE